MEIIKKINEEMSFVSEMDVSLANAIRRSVGEIPILAIDECDIYKNDSALYDEIIAHRLGLVSLKNQKMKVGQTVEMKMKAKGKGDVIEIMAGLLGDSVVYPETPIVLLGNKQEIELVARARAGKGNTHAKFMPGVIFYKQLPRIKISEEGKKHSELAELYPEVFEMFGNELRVKSAAACDLDDEDLKDYHGVSIEFGNDLVFMIESWGQIEVGDVFIEACKALKVNLSEVLKVVK